MTPAIYSGLWVLSKQIILYVYWLPAVETKEEDAKAQEEIHISKRKKPTKSHYQRKGTERFIE